MKLLLILSFVSISSAAWALDVPKDFEASQISGSDSKLWIHPKTLETIGISPDQLTDFEISESKDAFADIKATVEAKSRTLSWILNIKNWQILDSSSNSKDGAQLILFFGSYIDSSDELTMFAEAYWFPKTGKPESYLFTRAKQPYTAKELADRFKVQLP